MIGTRMDLLRSGIPNARQLGDYSGKDRSSSLKSFKFHKGRGKKESAVFQIPDDEEKLREFLLNGFHNKFKGIHVSFHDISSIARAEVIYDDSFILIKDVLSSSVYFTANAVVEEESVQETEEPSSQRNLEDDEELQELLNSIPKGLRRRILKMKKKRLPKRYKRRSQ